MVPQAVGLYFRFTLSFRDVGKLPAQHGVEINREAVWCWANKFGLLIAANLRQRRGLPTGRMRLDEMVAKTGGKRMYLWRAVDNEARCWVS
ncbi:MAG: IS6 family transposase [Parvibaculum sp.]|nr:IS6 family transposase [Parvibaculum sp.]